MPLSHEQINRTEVQSQQNALSSIREQFERIRRIQDITRDTVEGVFLQREVRINEEWAPLIANSPQDSRELESAKNEIVQELNVLKQTILDKIQALSGSTTAESERISERNKDAYRNFLHSINLISAEDSSPARPERRRREKKTKESSRSTRGRRTKVDVRRTPEEREAVKKPQDSRDKAAPREINIDTVIQQRSSLWSLIRPIENQRERQGFREDRREINLVFIKLAGNWSDVDMRFSLNFFNKIQNSNENVEFLKRAIRQPDELKELVKSLYQILLKIHPRPTDNNIERFFGGLENTIDRNTTISQAYARLVEGVQWEREMEKQPERIETIAARNTLFALERSINNRRLPEKEQLLLLQRLVRYLENNFLRGQKLTWEGLSNYIIINENVRMDRDVPIVNPNRSFIIQGNKISVRNVDVPGKFSISKATSPHNGVEYDFDIPHLLSTLRLVSETYSSAWEGQTTINFSHLYGEIERNPDALRNEINMASHRTLLRELGISPQRREIYENKFPETLSDLLGDPTDSKTPEQWANIIETHQGSARMDADVYKFLWVVRTYVRTRAVTGGPYTIQQFSEALMNSPNIRILDRINIPSQDFQSASRVLSSSPEASVNARYEYTNYLNMIPKIKEIFRFVDMFPPPSINEITLYYGNPYFTNAQKMIDDLDQVERESFSSMYVSVVGEEASFPRGRGLPGMSDVVQYQTNGKSLNLPRMLFSPEIINEYHRLKSENPLFREFISLAQNNNIMSFVALARFVFTPEQTTDYKLTF